MKRKYGWISDTKDERDYSFMLMKGTALPSSVDLRPSMPPVFDQGQLGSCTANAICAAYQYVALKNGITLDLSRLFLYYNERVVEGTINEDNGAMIRTGMKVLNSIGCCIENLDLYLTENFALKPSAEAYKDAKSRESIMYHRVSVDLHTIRAALAIGQPVIFGAQLFEEFESDEVARNGIIPMPKKKARTIGGHAILIVGYDDSTRMFIVRNSWGKDWGINGYCFFPYAYVTDRGLCDDFWVLQTIKSIPMKEFKTTAQLQSMNPADIIKLIEEGLPAVLALISSKPLLGWRKDEQEQVDTLKQQVAALSKASIDFDARLAAIEKALITPSAM